MKTTHLNLLKTIGYYFTFIALGLASAVLGPTLPALAEHTHTVLSAISIVFTVRALGYMFGSMQGGRMYDRLPGHLVLVISLVVMAVALFGVPALPLLGLLAVVLFVVGLAEGVVDAGTNTLIVWVHGHAVGPFMNLLHFFFGIGALTSPIIVAQVIGLSGTIDWAYRTLALFFIVPVLWLVGLPSPAPHKEAAVGSARHANPWLVALIAVFFFLYVGAEVGYGGWVYTYATRLGLSSQTTGAYLTSLFWGALTAGRLLSVPVAARLPPQTILFGDLAGCFASVALLLAFPSSTWIIWVATFLIGLSMASIFPTTLVLAGQKMTLTGKTTGWFFFGAGAGGMILPWIIGQLFEPIGPQVTIWLILFDLLLATIAYGLLMWRSRSLVVAPASD